MKERTTQSEVTFQRAFALPGFAETQPPGTYLIETIEEPLRTISFLAYRRISTTMMLPALGTATLWRQSVEIDPEDPKAALRKDIPLKPG